MRSANNATKPPRRSTCVVCGGSLLGRRRDAVFCSVAHRAEGSKLRRLLSGRVVERWYEDLPSYLDARQRRAERGSEGDAA